MSDEVTPTPQTAVQGFGVHDLGCRCWPHVSERDANEAVIRAATDEYRESVRARQAIAAEAVAPWRAGVERIAELAASNAEGRIYREARALLREGKDSK